MFARLVDAELSPAHAGVLTQIGFHGFKDDVAYFVAWQGWVPTGLKDKGGKTQKVYATGMWVHDLVRGGDLGKFLAQDDFAISVVINLDNIERRVKSALVIED